MIYYIIMQAFTIYTFMLIAYILLSWIPAAQDSAVGRFLATVCEPYLGFFRKFIPPIGMIDISPIVALFALRFIQQGLLNVISYII
ncbi:YggT family protein [Lysinibacillus sp. KU-BSD001]|uniref:YggT family protein n=1 Tax=Lysinibacillus sp. KU-BSD001 TaxID=3141328 RepID=UPI0036E4651C